MSDAKLPDGVPIVLDVDEKQLNRLQIKDYRDHRQEVLSWLWQKGKIPQEAKGYSKSVVENTAYRLSKIYRWVWENEGYTATLSHDHADRFVADLKTRDYGDENKNQYAKALKQYLRWRTHEQGIDEWELEQTYSPNQSFHHARDYSPLEERQLITQLCTLK